MSINNEINKKLGLFGRRFSNPNDSYDVCKWDY